MTGFEPGSSGIVSDRSANCATTTSLKVFVRCATCNKAFFGGRYADCPYSENQTLFGLEGTQNVWVILSQKVYLKHFDILV